MKNLSVGIVVVTAFVLMSCKNEPSGPPPPPPPKDPRTYTWTVDTLQHPESFQTMMTRIWGSSPNDVYVVGHNDVGKREMYHFNGQGWQPVPISQAEGGPIERPNLTDIFGHSPSNILAVGWRAISNPNPPPPTLWASLVIRFDGMRWYEIPTSGLYLQCISGNTAGLNYAAGQGNVGFFLSGSTFVTDTIPVTWPSGATFGIGSVTVTPSGEVYANGSWRQDFDTKYYFLHRASNGQWRTVDTAVVQPGLVENKWGYGKIWYSPWGQLYSVYGGVFHWNGSNWNRIFDSNGIALTDIKGRSASDLFVCGHFGLLYHFNGQDWHQFQQFASSELSLWGLLVLDNEVFAVCIDPMGRKSYILHGK